MELAKAYNPKDVEQEIHPLWADRGAFNAEPDDKASSYCIVIPPPNVTAPLHLGHALNNSLQDVLIRYRRMQQHNTLWMPGTDHAGIATQTVVEKRILAEENRRRTDFERGDFVERIQAWKDEYEARILEQLQKMGCSCDWRRTRFTMDETCAKAVRANFFNLFKDGLIYRGKRLVNWDPATQTVLADDEVEFEDVHGHFWYLRYPLVEPVEVPSGTAFQAVSPTDILSVADEEAVVDGRATHGQDARATNADGQRITHVTVATTRPETMLGDTAVAMNPSDPRAKYLVGKSVRLPIVGRVIPIIADEHVVMPDPDSEDEKARFSTGFLKVTPAHDPDDWAIGQRHDLPIINIMAPDGSISDKHGWDDWDEIKNPDVENLIGMDRFEAREAVVEYFRGEKLLEDVREYVHSVGHSYRSHVSIEPYLSDQWYIAVKKPIDHLAAKFGDGTLDGTDVPANSLAGLALKPLLDGKVRFVPDRYAKTYQTWLENLRDWPISRQLWWGHRIPVWSRDVELPADVKPITEGYDPDAQTVAALDRAVEGDFDVDFRKFGDVHYMITCQDIPDMPGWIRTHICTDRDNPECIAWLEKHGWERDADVLDTWFSSALWPFSTMGWPEQTPELETWYPGNLLCTAREIITLWVSRMVMMGQYCVGDIPFTDVFIHAMIQDGDGRKMSKSLGNGIDPLDIIDSHGADAMRYTLVSMTTQTQDVRMPVQELTLPDGRKANSSPKFDVGRNLCNKLWNASRFAMMNLASMPAWDEIHPGENLADRWILSRLNATIREATTALEGYRFNELAERLYHFMWDDFCDWYLEIAKARINAGRREPKAVLAHCLDVLLRLLHPIMPFITEAIWQRLNEVAPRRGITGDLAEPLLVRAQWPRANAARLDEAAERNFSTLQELIRQVRNVRLQHNVPPGTRVDAIVEAQGPLAAMIADNVELLKSQAQLGSVNVSSEPVQAGAEAAAITAGGVKLYVLGVIDREAELARLGKQNETLLKGIKGIEAKLGNEKFLAKAPPEVVQRERERLVSLQSELAGVTQSLEALGHSDAP